uniref:Thrombopoietin n=1 Tax=Periophthalmus magnuspinnatus TaxID=409849 RepID=A0A3B4AJ68_9GOBI
SFVNSGLLLLCVVISWPRDAQSLYIDFVCNKTVREALNIVSQMESDLLDCDDVATLPRAVQLPCTALHVASWGNKSLQEKRGDLVASLRLLIEGVKSASALNQTACATSVLRKLQHNVNNYLLILAHLDLSVSRFYGNRVRTGARHLCGSKHVNGYYIKVHSWLR